MLKTEAQTIDLKCPKCGSIELDNYTGARDWEGEEGYFEELTCSCGAIVVATYTAQLTSVELKD